LDAQGKGHVRLARQITAHLDAYLSATQLGITLASLGLGWLGEPFLADMIEPFFALANVTSPVLIETVAFALAFSTITILHIVLGELAPKSIAIRMAVPTTLWISRPLNLFYLVFRPAIWHSMGWPTGCSSAFSVSIRSRKVNWSTARRSCG
jgi:CBS domain containing-hemolysin-like protein